MATLISLLTSSLFFLTPLFFLPFTPDFFTTNKQLLVILISLSLLALTALTHLTQKKHPHSRVLALPLGIFIITLITNLLLTPEGRTEGLIQLGAVLIALAIGAYLISSLAQLPQIRRWTLSSIVASSTILALWGVLQLVILANLSFLPSWLQRPFFTPAGSILNLLLVLGIGSTATLSWSLKTNKQPRQTLLFIALGVQLAAMVAYVFMLTQGKLQLNLLPIQAGWPLALDALKSGKKLFFGVGLANFPLLFTQTKPAFLAQSNLWLSVFQKSSNEFFQLLSTTGLSGVLALGLVIFTTIQASRRLPAHETTPALRLTFYALVASFFLAPANIITYTWLFILMGIIAAQQTQARTTFHLAHYLPLVSAGVLTTMIIASGYFSYRVYAAERAMARVQQGFRDNNAQAVYTAQTKAIQLMPTMTSYRISFSQINLSLASSLSQAQNQASAEKQPSTNNSITDQQRQQITTLVQRAIDQGKVATQLRPSLFTTWQNLGNVYRNLINVGAGAENFALQYLGQAVALSPNDPTLRLEFGGLYYQLAQLTQDQETQQNLLSRAVQQFQLAVSLRPSFANGHYNLSKALEQQGQFRLAYQALTQTLANLEPDSSDYQTAQTELLELEKKLPQAPAQPTSPATPSNAPTVLQKPQPLPSPLPGGPIELPQSQSGGLEKLITPEKSPTATAPATTSVTPTPQ